MIILKSIQDKIDKKRLEISFMLLISITIKILERRWKEPNKLINPSLMDQKSSIKN